MKEDFLSILIGYNHGDEFQRASEWAVAEIERQEKLIKQYEEAIPALVKENEELRAEVQQLKKTADERLSYEWSTDAENERLRANAGN